MKMYFIRSARGLSLFCFLMGSFSFVGAQQHTPLDEAAQVGLQQSLNDIFNRYNGQITQAQSQMDHLRGAGMQQCAAQAQSMANQAAQTKDAAATQALMGMIGPGMETMGHVLDGALKAGGGEKVSKQNELNTQVQNCKANNHLRCDASSGATVNTAQITVTCNTKATAIPDPTAKLTYIAECERTERGSAASEATNYTTQITKLNKELGALSGMSENLIGTGMQLAAAGITGGMMKSQAEKQAGYMTAEALAQKDLCELQVQNQIKDLQRQIQQLEAAKARDIMMANMMAEYQTRQRERALQPEDTPFEGDEGGIIDLGVPDFAGGGPSTIKTAGKDGVAGPGAGGGGPAGGGGGSTGGGGVGDPAWVFGDGAGGFDGGSPLPAQPQAASFAGTAANPANTGKGGGGFGAFAGKPSDDEATGERGPASEVQELGDGGLQVLLARTSIVHSRHAAALVRGIDFDSLAKATPPDSAAQKAAAPSARY
jgi:hypothetical protein